MTIKNSFITFLTIIIGMISFCYASEDEYNDPHFYGDTFNWEKSDPFELLELLKSKQNEKCPTYSIYEMHTNWVKIDHIPELISLLDSKEPCANVCSIYSSFRDCNKSTIGREAAFLIEGYRQGKYPPSGNSGGADEIIEELKNWWKIFTGKNDK